MKKIYDISVPVSNDTVIWPGDPEISIDNILQTSAGDPCNLTRISMGAHTGTHIDAPYHFISGGKTIDQIDPEIFIGDCIVAEFTGDGLIDADFIKKLNLENIERILFKTKNSSYRNENKFNENFISLSLDAASMLIDKKIKLTGIDYLSVESFNAAEGNPVHEKLLSGNIIILENINLCNISPGIYELICLPVFFRGIEAAPVRAVLRDK